jgi:hypothetical protein
MGADDQTAGTPPESDASSEGLQPLEERPAVSVRTCRVARSSPENDVINTIDLLGEKPFSV